MFYIRKEFNSRWVGFLGRRLIVLEHQNGRRAARGGYSLTLPTWVCAAQRGRDFEAPDLEWGIHFRGVF